MKVIPLGLQCSTPEGIRRANIREYSYPFDWLWSPSKTTYNILKILINDGIDLALEYMTTGYKYYKYLGNERYILVDEITECQMNKDSGLGNTHFIINSEEYKNKLKTRLERLLTDITRFCIVSKFLVKKAEFILFLFIILFFFNSIAAGVFIFC